MLQLMTNSRTPGELKNCKLENPSLLFGPLGSDKRRVLRPSVKNILLLCSCVMMLQLVPWFDWACWGRRTVAAGKRRKLLSSNERK